MAKQNYDQSEGRWVTIAGRRVFIENEQGFSDAMRLSGQFDEERLENIQKKSKKYNDDVEVICKIPAKEILEKEYGELKNDDVIITSERKEHIDERRKGDAEFVREHMKEAIENYDALIDAGRGCVRFIKSFDDGKTAVVVWLSLKNEELANSVLTGIKISQKEVNRLLKKWKVLDKR